MNNQLIQSSTSKKRELPKAVGATGAASLGALFPQQLGGRAAEPIQEAEAEPRR